MEWLKENKAWTKLEFLRQDKFQVVHKKIQANISYSWVYLFLLPDKPDVRAHAHIEDTLWSIQIFEKNDIYAVEVVVLFF